MHVNKKSFLVAVIIVLLIIAVAIKVFNVSFKITFFPHGMVHIQQEELRLFGNITSFAYTITAPQNSNPDNITSGFLITGLTNTGYWYEFGLEDGLFVTNGIQQNSSYVIYRVALPNGTFSQPYSKPFIFQGPEYGDKVLLGMYISNNTTYLVFNDLSNNNLSRTTYFKFPATHFVSPGPNGEFTGILSEYVLKNNITLTRPEVSYKLVNISINEQNKVALAIGEIAITTNEVNSSAYIYGHNFTIENTSFGYPAVLRYGTYSEYYYPNGTFVTN